MKKGVGIPMYQGNADFGFRFPTNRVFTTDPKRFAEIFDTLISVRAPVGEQNMANEKCCIGRGVAAFRYKNEKIVLYLYIL
jgi:type I restriction enzyme S subunit